jgi:hypothetical protein
MALGLIAALIIVVSIGAAVWLVMRERQATAQITEELEAARARLDDQAEQMDAARETFAKYRSELRNARSQMVTQHDEVKESRRAAASRSRLEALWTLVRLEQHRSWRLTLAPSSAGWPDEPLPDLTGILKMEVERIREEVGTPGSVEASIDDVRPEDAVLCVSATRELLRVLTMHTHAYEVSAWTKYGQLNVEVLCSGWEGNDVVLADTAGIRDALVPVGGDLRLEPPRKSRLRATLSLPMAE